MLDKALLSQMTGGLWSEDKTQAPKYEKYEKTLPVEEKSPHFLFTGKAPEYDKEARRILREAMKKSDLLDSIKERASIRWSNGLSDSLFNAVLCNLKPLNEKTERDSNGEIILQPKTDWQEELTKFEGNEG